MKLTFTKCEDKIIGALRVPTDVFVKIEKLANKAGVSNQEIVRAILSNYIDEVEV